MDTLLILTVKKIQISLFQLVFTGFWFLKKWISKLEKQASTHVYKGFSLSAHDCPLIDRVVSTAHCRSSSSTYWVGLFVPPWLLVIGASRTSLMVGGFRSKVLFVLSEEETDPSAVVAIVVVASGSMHEKKKNKAKRSIHLTRYLTLA